MKAYTAKIGGERFDIKDVNVASSELYRKMLDKSIDFNALSTEAEEIDLEYMVDKEKAETGGQKAEARIKQLRASRELTKRGRQIEEDICNLRDEILREILEFNGHKYDAMFWKKKASVEDINDLIVETVGGGSKKKVKTSST